MPPEQARGENVDWRADLYSLGAIAYRCATGQPPYGGKDLPAILHAVVYTMPARPSDIAELHEDVDLALAVAMAKRPKDRFDTGSELAESLELAFDGKLDELTRRLGRALLAEMPWRSRV
jgi:serine/threonine-protein kinase